MNEDMHTLDPRWVSYRRRVGLLRSLGFAAVLGVGTAFAIRAHDLPAVPLGLAAALVAVTAIGLGQWWPGVAWRHARYRLGARALEIRRGVLWRRVIDVPRSRIQHSDVSQGPIERLHGLGTLAIFTAGTQHSRVELNGLDHGRALAIRDHLMQLAEDDVI